MTPDELEIYINKLISKGTLWKFYKSSEWLSLRAAVMKECHGECQDCKKKGFHTKARSVHHEQWIKKHPRLALSRTYTYQGKEYPNLIPLCEACHNARHPEKGSGQAKNKKQGFINEERW